MIKWKILKPNTESLPIPTAPSLTILGLEGCPPCSVAAEMAVLIGSSFADVKTIFYKTERSWWDDSRPIIYGRKAGVFPTIIGGINQKEIFREYGAPQKISEAYIKNIVILFFKRGKIELQEKFDITAMLSPNNKET